MVVIDSQNTHPDNSGQGLGTIEMNDQNSEEKP